MELPFVNDDILTGDVDIIIGGFVTDKVENFTYNDFYSALRDRISVMIEQYVEADAIILLKDNHPDPKQEALHDCAMVIGDNLKVVVELLDVEAMTNTILKTEYIQNWLFRVKFNIEQYLETDVQQYKGIYNKAIHLSPEDVEHYNTLIHDTTFEEMIEAISMVEI